MILIGFLHHNLNPKKVKKAYAYAAIAKAEGAELLYFAPEMVSMDTEEIEGYQYSDGEWKPVKSRLPDVIYNTGSPAKFKEHKAEINFLKKNIPFTTFSIGNKISVYQRLLDDEELIAHLIPSIMLQTIDDLKAFFTNFKKVVVKPVNGHKGQGIIYITKDEKDYIVQLDDQIILMKEKELINLLFVVNQSTHYLAQPYIHSVTKTGLSFDIRLHTQKNGEGRWNMTAMYPRIAKAGSIVTNINNGGATNYIDPFLTQEFGDYGSDLKRQFETFAMKCSKKLDALQMKLFHQQIDELGIDIGLDDNHHIWIYEVNWRPGCPPAFYLEMDVVKNGIRYAMYLARKRGYHG